MRTFCLTLNWEGEDKLKNLAEGLFNNLFLLDSQKPPIWLVRDNNSKDNSIEFLQNFAKENNIRFSSNINDLSNIQEPMIYVKKMGHNRDNFAVGMNSLFEEIEHLVEKDDWLLLLNNDISFGNSCCLQEMFRLTKLPKVAIVGARLLYPNSRTLQHAGVIFSEVKYNKNPYHYLHKQDNRTSAEQNRYFQAVTAACCLVKAKVFEDVGKFDHRFNWCFDDIDLNLKIKTKGYKIAYCGKTVIYHEESASLKKNKVNLLSMDYNVRLFKDKWAGKYNYDLEKYEKDPYYQLIKDSDLEC